MPIQKILLVDDSKTELHYLTKPFTKDQLLLAVEQHRRNA